LFGVTVSSHWGALASVLAFACFARALWIASLSATLRLGIICSAALVYGSVSGNLLVSPYRLDQGSKQIIVSASNPEAPDGARQLYTGY